jgi:hypothetical protein
MVSVEQVMNTLIKIPEIWFAVWFGSSARGQLER